MHTHIYTHLKNVAITILKTYQELKVKEKYNIVLTLDSSRSACDFPPPPPPPDPQEIMIMNHNLRRYQQRTPHLRQEDLQALETPGP